MTVLTGLEILIERMKTHPHEFIAGEKWTDLLVNIDKHLTDEERQALKQGFSDMARETFNGVVLKSLAGEGVTREEVALVGYDYDTVMSYPRERRRMAEEEQRQRMEQQLMADKMRMELEMKHQRSMQNPAYGQRMGLLGNQAKGVW